MAQFCGARAKGNLSFCGGDGSVGMVLCGIMELDCQFNGLSTPEYAALPLFSGKVFLFFGVKTTFRKLVVEGLCSRVSDGKVAVSGNNTSPSI